MYNLQIAENNFKSAVLKYPEAVPVDAVDRLIACHQEALSSGNYHKFVMRDFQEFLIAWSPARPVLHERKKLIFETMNGYARELEKQ